MTFRRLLRLISFGLAGACAITWVVDLAEMGLHATRQPDLATSHTAVYLNHGTFYVTPAQEVTLILSAITGLGFVIVGLLLGSGEGGRA
jgi:hypothetical protein